MQDWLQGILSGIALGMAMLPEEFPVALAIFLAIGSWRLAQVGVLVLAISQVWRDSTGSLFVATKGAPEAVVGMCSMSPSDTASVVDRAHHLANEGLRVLAVAEATWGTEVLPDDPRQFAFRYLGLLAFEDPVRASVPAAVAAAHAAGSK